MKKQYKDSDEIVYSLSRIKQLNKSYELLDEQDMERLETMAVGERVNNPMDGFWFERIK